MVSKLKHKKLLTILIGVCAFVMLCGTVLAVIYTTGVKGVTLAGTKQDAADKNNKAQQEGSVTANSVNAPAVMADGESTDDTSSTTLEGYCTFYDYVVAPYTGNQYKKRGYKEYPKRSINTSSNYSNNGKSKLTVGTTDQNYRQNRYSCLVNGLDVNTCIYYNDGKFKTVSTFDGTKKEYYLASQGIIKGLDPDDYRKVIFNVDEPGLFTDDAKIGKTVIKDYKLVFKKADNGNRSSTYTLDYVLSPKGNKTPAGDNFFPLNDSDSNVLDGGYGGADGNIGTNYYFGMRYDVEFALNGYDDDLLYKFTGDDDLWVFLDGELVLDLGGIHPSCGGDVDLWQTGPLAKELAAAGYDKSGVDQHKKHIITVLYMERGGNLSNCNMKFTVPDSARIITIDDYDVDKTVTLNNWEDRTYDVTLGVYLKDTEGVIIKDITNVTVRDYIDSRFNVIDDNGNIVTADKDYADNHSGYAYVMQSDPLTVNGGTIGYDTDKGMVYVEWNNQTVESNAGESSSDDKSQENAGEADTRYGWKKVIQVKAAYNYAGGNNVTTNGAGSGVTVDGKFKEFPQPRVNVRTIPAVKNIEDVIFYGDTLTDTVSKENVLQNMLELNGANLREDGEPLSYGDFSILWYKDDKEVSEADIGKSIPESDTAYKVKVNYGVTKVSADDECTKNSKGYIADEKLYNVETDVNGSRYDYAMYTIHVVKGELDITKLIDEQYTDNKIIRANQTYVFRIEQYGFSNVDKEEVKGELSAVFYQPVAFDANGDVIKKTAVISGLRKGFYTVREDTDWTMEYNLADTSDNYSGNDNGAGEACDMFIGKTLRRADYADGIRAEFYGLDSTHYGYLADGESARAEFVNNKSDKWKWLSDAASAINSFIGIKAEER